MGCHTNGFSGLITSAPRSASSMVAKGPAQTTQRSTTRTPSSGRSASPLARRAGRGGAALGAGLRESSFSTSFVCLPSRGAGRRSSQPPVSSRNGRPGRVTRPSSGCSMLAQKPRPRKCSSSNRSCMLKSGPHRTLARRASAQISRLVRAMHHALKCEFQSAPTSGFTSSSGSPKRGSASQSAPRSRSTTRSGRMPATVKST